MDNQIEATIVSSRTSILGREPVMWLAMIQAGVALAIGFGFDVTMTQFGLIMAFVAALLGFIARSQVTPVEAMPDIALIEGDTTETA